MTVTAPTSIAFSRLVAPDAINARASTKDGIDELAASIATKGLIQPLAVRPADGSDKYEIIAGRRRYQALAKLVKAKTLPKSHPVPVLVRNETDAEALETSLMENTQRLPMHAVEQYEVFARLADGGLSVPEIATRHAISERTVRQQLALGRLAPKVRDAWKKGTIDADTAKAFAGSGASHDMQAETLTKLTKQGKWSLSAHSVRNELCDTRQLASDIHPRTLALYQERGGHLTPDLFEDRQYVDDLLLLAACRKELTAVLMNTLKAEGWGWVSHNGDLPRDWRHWGTLNVVEFTDAQNDTLDNLDGEAHDDKAMEFVIAGWTADQKASAGAIIVTNHDGSVSVHRGALRDVIGTPVEPDEADDELGDGSDYLDAGDDLPSVTAMTGTVDDDDAPDADPFAISGALMETITTSQTLAAAAAVRQDPDLALRLAVASMLVPSYATPVKVSHSRFIRGVGDEADRDFDTELARLAAQPTADVLATLAQLVAEAVTLRQHHHDAKRDDDKVLVSVLRPEAYREAMLAEFIAADYFRRATKATALAAIDEMIEAGCGAGLAPVDVLADMKKAELAEVAAARATASGWLPPQLRHPAYALIPAMDGAA